MDIASPFSVSDYECVLANIVHITFKATGRFRALTLTEAPSEIS